MIQVTEYETLGKGRLSVCLDNGMELVLYRGEAKQVGLEADMPLSDETYRILLNEIVGKRAKKRALHLLERMDRTEHQLREKLTQGGYPSECIDDAIAYVKSFRYLDDYRYACNLVRCSQERLSRQKLRMKLAQKGISRDVIERALAEEYEADEEKQIRGLLEKRHYNFAMCDDRERQRNYQYLMRRGFKSCDILRVMRQAEADIIA